MPTFSNSIKAAIRTVTSWAFSSGNGRGGYEGNYFYGWRGSQSGNGIDWAGQVGDPWRNSSVFALINAVGRIFPEAPVGVSVVAEDDVDHSHPFANLMRRPNQAYGRSTLWQATVVSYIADGNAYWFKKRNAAGEVVEYWYRPHWLVRPVRVGKQDFISYYEYWADREWHRIEKSEVIHLRNSLCLDNELRGVSPLRYHLKNIFTDEEANAFCAIMLGNQGMPGAVLTHGSTWKGTTIDPLGAETAAAVQSEYVRNFTGEGRGLPLILDGDWKVDFPQIAVDSSFVEKCKNLSQADLCAAIGFPAVVVGFFVGLQEATAKASHADARQQAYTDCIMPMQTGIAEDLTVQALPDFSNDPRIEVAFDYTKVSALQENGVAKADRFQKLATAAKILISAGFDPTDTLQQLEMPDIKFNGTPAPAGMQQLASGQDGSGAAGMNGTGPKAFNKV